MIGRFLVGVLLVIAAATIFIYDVLLIIALILAVSIGAIRP